EEVYGVITYLGSKSLGECVPVAVQAQASLDAQLSAQLPEIQAKLEGFGTVLMSLTVSPPDVQGSIDAALQTVASLQASLSVSGPSVTLQIDTITQAVAELQVQLAQVQAQLALSAQLGASFGASGIHLLAYDGRLGSFGNELQGALSPVGDSNNRAQALVLVTTSSAAWSAMSTIFGVSL